MNDQLKAVSMLDYVCLSEKDKPVICLDILESEAV